MLLVDTRPEPPRPDPVPERPPWEPNWRMWGWIAVALACTVAASTEAATGFAGFLLVCVAFGCGCRALTVALPYGDGLREHRQ